MPCNPHEIIITNNIKPSMLSCYGQKPQFTLSINGKTLSQQSSICVPLSNKTVVIRYDYNFLKGTYQGANEVTFELDDCVKKNYEVTFSWNNEFRIILPGGKAKKKTPIKL